MIVDAHLHLFRNGYGQFGGSSPLGETSDIEAYEHLMSEHGISAGLVVCYEDEGIDPSNNAYVRELAATRPWIRSVAFLKPSPPPTVEEVSDLLAAGHIGIALYLPDEASADALYRWPPEAWEMLSQSHAIVSFNARPEAIRRLQLLVERANGCAFLFSHLGLPGRYDHPVSSRQAADRLEPLLQLASCPNVGVKLSGLYAIDPIPPHKGALPFIDLLLERFRAEDLHWGSDFSPALGFVRFEETFSVPALGTLGTETRDLVQGESLMRKFALTCSV
jgi:predicted TIM-barrel fold metal-dependent hydrolase